MNRLARIMLMIGLNTVMLTGFTNFAMAGSVSGVIRGSSGEPISNAEVRYDRRNVSDVPLFSSSDSNGAYSFLDVSGVGHITVKPEVSSGYSVDSEYVYIDRTENRTGMNFQLKRGFRASVQFHSTSNLALGNINLQVGQTHNKDFAVLNVNSDGLCDMNLPEGTYHFSVKPDRHLGYPQIIAGPVSSVQSMRVYDVSIPDEEGVFIPIGFHNPDNHPFTSELEIAAIPAGTYANANIDNFGLYNSINTYGWSFPPDGGLTYGMWVPPGSYDSVFMVVNQTSDGIQSFTFRGVHERVQASPENIETFTYDSEGGTITGTLTYRGVPMWFYALVFLTDSNGRLAGWAESGPDSRYTFYNVPAGSYTLQAKKPEWWLKGEKTSVSVIDGESTEANLVFSSGTASVSGTLTDETGGPLPNMNVMYDVRGSGDDYETYSDQDGNYLFENLPQGIGYVTVKPEVSSGYTFVDRHVYLEPGENETGIDFRLKRGVLVSGFVRHASGGAFTEEVECANGDGTRFSWVDPDPTGYYEMMLEPDTYRFYIDKEGYTALPITQTITGPTRLQDILVYDFGNGSVINGNVSVNTPPHAPTFFGGAFESGEVANITIDNFHLYDPIAYAELPFTGLSNVPYGLFVPPSDRGYDVFFGVMDEREGYPPSFTLRGGRFSGNGSYDVNFNSEGGTVSGIVSYDGSPLLMATVLLTDASSNHFAGFAETDQDGQYTFYNVPAGNYYLQAKKYGGAKSEKVTLAITVNGQVITRDINIIEPQISLIQPSQGEVLIGGSDYAIRWTAVGSLVDHIKILYSTDAGVTYPNVITASTANTGMYTWIVPSIDSTAVKVKVIAEDSSDTLLAEDESDGSFTIATLPASPSSLTAAAIYSQAIRLTWQDHSDNETGFKIERSRSSDSGYLPIFTASRNATSYTHIDQYLSPGVTYYYRVCAYNAFGNSEYAGASVTIPIPIPVIKRIVPNQARVGDMIAIHGANFGSGRSAAQTVMFYNTATRIRRLAQIISWSDTDIQCIVPSLPVDQYYFVKVTTRYASSSESRRAAFRVLP